MEQARWVRDPERVEDVAEVPSACTEVDAISGTRVFNAVLAVCCVSDGIAMYEQKRKEGYP